MSSVVIAGNTSGTVTLDAPDVAGSTVLTLPATSGTVLTSSSSQVTGAAFSASRGTDQSVTAGANTKIQLNNESFDTASCFDTSTYRFTPTVAGYYQFTVTAVIASSSTGYYSDWSIYKNGSTGYTICGGGGNGSSYYRGAGGALIYLNGSTDYVELYAYLSVTNNVQARLDGFLARSA